MKKLFKSVQLDKEWVLLIKIAKDLGIPIGEIRQFLYCAGKKA